MNPPQNPRRPPEPKSASYLLFFSIVFAIAIVVWINRDYLRREWNISTPAGAAAATPRATPAPADVPFR